MIQFSKSKWEKIIGRERGIVPSRLRMTVSCTVLVLVHLGVSEPPPCFRTLNYKILSDTKTPHPDSVIGLSITDTYGTILHDNQATL